MDIKTRIDALTEAEAKAALVNLIRAMANYSNCYYYDNLDEKCPAFERCRAKGRCELGLLDLALEG